MGKEEGERLQIEHIRQMELYQSVDSVPYPKQEYFENSNGLK